MQAAKLDTKITIQQLTTTQTEIGEAVESWSTYEAVFAHRTSRPGKDFFQSGKVYAESNDFFTIRHLDGITSKMRVVCGSDTFEIVDVQYSDQRRVSIQLTCKRVS